MPVVVCVGSAIAAAHHTRRSFVLARGTTAPRREKSPRHCGLGLNPPMTEVEETIGSIDQQPTCGRRSQIE
jgi:hypothetical protein